MLAHLLEAALRSLLLGCAAWAAIRLLRVQNPQARMTVWTAVLIASLAMPALMHWATVTVRLAEPPPAVSSLQPSSSTAAPTLPAAPAAELGAVTAASSPGTEAARHSQPPARNPLFSAAAWPALTGVAWPALAAALYLAVAGVLLLRLAAGLVLTWRLLRRACPVMEPWARGLDVRVSAAAGTPVSFGPVILLPAGYTGWDPAKRRAVLAHENAHIQRYDFYVLLLAALHRAVFWFSPFSWWLLSELAKTAEFIGDDAAARTLGDRPGYAEILLDAATASRRIPAAIAMARPHTVVQRIERILTITAPQPLRRSTQALIAASLVPLTAIAALSVTATSEPASAALPPSSRRPAASAQHAPDLWLVGKFNLISATASAGDMFDMDAEWPAVAKYTSTVQLPPPVLLNAKDEDLKRAFEYLDRRHIGLAVWLNVLEWPEKCSDNTGPYGYPANLERMLARLHRLGAKVKYAVFGAQYYYGHVYPTVKDCRLSAEEVAALAVKKMPLIRSYLPDAEIGLTDFSNASSDLTNELIRWTDVFQQATGVTPAFFHVEARWSRQAVRNLKPLADAMKARHIPFGIVYDGLEQTNSGEARSRNIREHIAAVETGEGIHPDTAIFRSWPARLLPEKQPGTFANLVYGYLQAPPSIALTRQSNMVTGQVVDAEGRPVASANVTLEALDAGGHATMADRHLTQKVPPGAVTAAVGMRVNQDGSCVCAGWADVSIGTIRYREDGTGRQEEFAPFPPDAGGAVPPVRRMQLVPGERVSSDFKQFSVTPGAAYDLDVPLSVPANGERAAYVGVMFMDANGKEIQRDRLWFQPFVHSLGTMVTDAGGWFRVEIPHELAAAEPEIRAYFAGIASVGSQSAALRQ